MNIKGILAAALSSIALVSCVKNEFVPSATNPSAAFVKKNITIAGKGETVQVGIKATCDWTATTGASWVKVSPAFGTSATKNITVTVDTEISADESREATVILANALNTADCDTLYITQCSFDGHIRTAEHMLIFLEMASSATDADFFTFENDIDMEGETLVPAAKFAGSLDGQGHKLYNFVIESDNNAAGLILNNTGLVKNLNVGTADGKTWDKVSTIKFKDGITGTAAGFVAVNSGVVGGINNFATVDFNAASDAADAAVGGIVGVIGTKNAQIIDCNNYGSICYTGTQGNRSSMGGILGLNGQPGPAVENCANYGVISKATANAKEFAMAGIVGRSNDMMTIKGCINAGPVSYDSTDKPGSYIHIAGVVGAAYKNCQILDCVNKAAVSSVILQVNRIGGIAGTMNTGGLIRSCLNEGQVSINQGANANWQAAAGICGFEEKGSSSMPLRIENCINKGEVSGVFENTNTHNNQVALGGIIGTTCSVVEYSGNTNSGKIVAKNTGSANVYAGGLYGWYRAGSGFNSHDNVNDGEVSVEAPSGAAGGIIGNLSVAESKLKSDTNKGAVTFATASATGSIAGLTAAPVNSCAVGGKVNDVEITQANFASYIVGSASTGAPVACYFEGGSGPVAYVVVAPAAITVPFGGAAETVVVTSNTEWDYACTETWVEVSVATGEGEAREVLVTVAPNAVKEQRVATVTFTSKTDAEAKATLTVTQEPYTDGLPGNKITSAADWAKFVAIAGEAAAGDVYTIENDIDMAGAVIASVGSFAGTLDGKNHKIYNAKIESASNNAGLILSNLGTVKNLIFGSSNGTSYDGQSVITFASSVVDALAAGVVATNSGIIENVINFASVVVNVKTNAGKPGFAGIAGVMGGTAPVIKNCKNHGSVNIDAADMAGESSFGGILGYTNIADATITGCYNYADMVTSVAVKKVLMFSGIVARIGAVTLVEDCHNEGNIKYVQTASPTTWIAVGGINGAAYNNATITRCTNKGKISSDLMQVNRLGGIAGVLNSSGIISENTNSGDVEFKAGAEYGNWLAVGGILGFQEKQTAGVDNVVKNNLNTGKVIISTKTTNATVGCGGIIGVSKLCQEVSGNKNTGMVVCESANTAMAGGVVGYVYDKAQPMSNNINEGEVKAVGANGKNVLAGGVVGYTTIAGSTFNGDKNFGAVSAQASDSENCFAGSLFGWNKSTATGCGAGGSVNGTDLTSENFNDLAAGKNDGTISETVFVK